MFINQNSELDTMRIRTTWLIVAIAVLAVLTVAGPVGAMALTQGGLMGNSYNQMMGNQQGYPGMMGGQQGYPGMMGGYPSTPAQQGTPVTGVTQVTIQNFAYQPANIQVRAGTTVTWTNQDNVPHSITFKNGMKDSGLLAHGQSFSYMFTAPGTYHYYCTVHPYMIGIMTVVS